MKESTLTPLKILVERAVRPVRASTSRKRPMREELLAHVSAVFEEEFAQLGDERAALERTAQRFGNPAELGRQLQEVVPASDRLDRLVEQLAFPPGESTLRRALRHASAIGLLSLTVLLVALGGSSSASAGTTQALWYCGSVALSLFLMVFGFYFLVEWMRQALFGPAGRSWRKAALVAATTSLFYSATTIVHVVVETWLGGHDVWSMVPFAVYFAAGMVSLVAVMAPLADDRVRYLQEWAALPID